MSYPFTPPSLLTLSTPAVRPRDKIVCAVCYAPRGEHTDQHHSPVWVRPDGTSAPSE